MGFPVKEICSWEGLGKRAGGLFPSLNLFTVIAYDLSSTMMEWTIDEEKLAVKQQQMIEESRRNAERKARNKALEEAKAQQEQLRYQQHYNSRKQGNHQDFNGGYQETFIADYEPHVEPAVGMIDRQEQMKQSKNNAATSSQDISQSASFTKELTSENETPAADGEAQLQNYPNGQDDNSSLKAIPPPYKLKITTEAAYKAAKMKH